MVMAEQSFDDPVGSNYQGRPRTWGFRLSRLDIAVIVASSILTALLWKPTASYSFIGLLVVIHFFLFCNVFRIPRIPELIWGASFLIVCTACLVLELYSPWMVSISILPVTVAVLVWSIRLPSYHGILANRINPRLEEFLAGGKEKEER